ncbi:hypothetical protein [Pontibacter flavimaris]|uniref:hypothetical protein n=1 Tax=Pontibacter flavimaris TaxID=1797110 RepID=UPI00111510B0|nr:hypothetical protein [Pontibacter flavimaris]
MMTKSIRIATTALFAGSLVFLTSCESGANNTEMPPESTQGETQETGAPIDGDKPGTGADSANVNDVLAGEEDTTANQ